MESLGASKLILPPCRQTTDGRERRIGVEIEFANLDCPTAARIIQRRFGGVVRERSQYRFEVEQTEHGTFTVELDSRYVHGPTHAVDDDDVSKSLWSDGQHITDALERQFYSALGDIGSLWLPVEIVAPPLPIEQLLDLDLVVEDLRSEGAEGTEEGLLYAFATQLNPEVPSLEHESILKHLKAFLLLSDWLRKEINLDVKRRLLPFIDPFPKSFVKKVVDNEYRPNRDQLIDDYLEANPTRNRELDLLPLFAKIDPDRVKSHVDDPRIKPRPTFHYRLPDTRLDDPEWGVVTEWNRWVRVEQLAADDSRLRNTSEEYLDRKTEWLPHEWIDTVDRLFR